MPVRPSRRVAAALTTLALGAGLVAAASTSFAADSSTPPWEPDAQSAGTLTFYDASGNAITSGSTNTGPFAAYAVGSQAVRSGDTQARLEFANPQSGVATSKWYRADVNGFNNYPLTTGPAAATTSSPTWVGSASGLTLDAFETSAAKSTDSAYANYVQVRLVTANSNNQPTATYGVADVLVDSTTHTWKEAYPTNTTGTGGGTPTTHATSLAIAATPQITFGQKATVKAHLADTTTSTGIAGQTLTLKQRSTATGAFTTYGTVTTNSNGDAAVAVTPGTYRQYEWSYAGSTSATQPYSASDSVAARVLVAQFVSGYVTSASIKSGANVKFYGAVSPVLAGETIYLQALSGGTYKNVSGVTGVIKNQKLPNGKTGYGFVLSLNPKTKATYNFRAFAPSTKNNTYGVSVAHLVKVS